MLKAIVVSTAMVVGLAASAQAATLNWYATLEQAQNVNAFTPVASATGLAFGTIDDASGLLSWTVEWSGLSGDVTGLHFHVGAAGATGPVVVDIADISGTTSPSIGSAILPQIGVDSFLAGNYYVNLHTALNPNGEIRGQVAVSAVPLPAAAPLSLGALSLLGALRLRRKMRKAA